MLLLVLVLLLMRMGMLRVWVVLLVLVLQEALAHVLVVVVRRAELVRGTARVVGIVGSATISVRSAARASNVCEAGDVVAWCTAVDAAAPPPDDGAGVDLAEVRGDSDFEFRIPTEQSTIYALIIDEQREYFHGKVAQFFYRQRYESFAGDGVASSSRHISRANSHQVLRSASHHSLKSQPSSRRLSQAANPLTLQWLLSCEKEIAFHAEQAGLWSLAMRAYLHAAILSRRLGDHRHFVGGLLEAFKIVKCCEQDSGESITPLSLS
eukprot:gene36099-46195_t